MQGKKATVFRGRSHITLWILVFSGSFPVVSTSQPLFQDATAEAGIDHFFEIFQGTFGGGAVVIDFDLDGWEDLFIAGGHGTDQLLRNEGDGTFSNKTEAAGLHVFAGLVTQGAASTDVNKDGWPDLFVTTIASIQGSGFTQAPNVLLINKGDGTFEDHSLAYGFSKETFSTSASFGDVNKDGYPDLYVCNYFDQYTGELDAFNGPQTTGDIMPGKDLFYINNGRSSFIEASELYGIQRVGLTFQALWSDFDNDGDLDILVANDFGNRGTPNLLYRNDYPKNSFTEVGDENDFDFGINAMGIRASDINEDGWLDYKITNIQISPFLINGGRQGGFDEESVIRGSGFANVRLNGGFRITPVSWGSIFSTLTTTPTQICTSPMDA